MIVRPDDDRGGVTVWRPTQKTPDATSTEAAIINPPRNQRV